MQSSELGIHTESDELKIKIIITHKLIIAVSHCKTSKKLQTIIRMNSKYFLEKKKNYVDQDIFKDYYYTIELLTWYI